MGLGSCPLRKFFNFRLSEIVSDAISGVKEQELLQIGNSNSACPALKIDVHTRRRGATIIYIYYIIIIDATKVS